tara:strand:+ start:3561 stop:3857 length:297 start_codon:yes stop_codon:yes gene_type:complete
MNSTNDKSRDIQDFLKKIKESGEEDKFKDMLNKVPITQKVDNFLNNQQMMAQNFNNPAGLPQDLYEATMRQYGRKEFGDYTTDDMKLIIEAQKNKGLV